MNSKNNNILKRKKLALIDVLNSMIYEKSDKIAEDYTLIFLNTFSILEGFDYKLLKEKILNYKSTIELRIFFIIFETITKDYRLDINFILKKYNDIWEYRKLHRYSLEARESIYSNTFSLFLETNKNFKSDKKTYIEYLPENATNDISNIQSSDYIEYAFLKYFFDNDETVYKKSLFIKNFMHENGIKNDNLEIIKNLEIKYDSYFNKINAMSQAINKKDTLLNKKKVKENIADDEKSFKVESKTIKYKNILNPFFPPKLKREDEYIFFNQTVYYNINKFDENIKKEIYDIIPHASNYSLPYNKNKILLQVLAKNEIYDYAKDSIDDLKSKGIQLDNFVFLRIYDIHKNWSNFKSSFSIEYKDFLESDSIKSKDYFEIILEYKKGTATREYLDLFLKEQKNKYFDLLHEDEFEAIVNEALCNWERKIDDINISIPINNDFFKNTPYAPIFEDEILKFVPEHEWIKHKITFNIEEDEEIFGSIASLRDYYKIFLKTNLLDTYQLLYKIRDRNLDNNLLVFWFNIFKNFEKSLNGLNINEEDGYLEFLRCIRKRTSEINDFFKNSYNSSSKIESVVYEQEKWLFDYNKKILESKKRAIINSLEEYCSTS